jgi:hypothetical protein
MKPAPPTNRQPGTTRGSLSTVLTALVLTLAMLGAMSLISLGFVLVFCIILGIAAFHFVLWGWWLRRALEGEQEDKGPVADREELPPEK